MTHVEQIRAALATLCFRARVSPDDGSRASADAIRALLARDRHPVTLENRTDPAGCGLVSWLSAATGIPAATSDACDPHEPSLLVGERRVIYQGWRKADGTRDRVCIDLPRAVAAALRPAATASRVAVTCRACGVERLVSAQSLKFGGSGERSCMKCARKNREAA